MKVQQSNMRTSPWLLHYSIIVFITLINSYGNILFARTIQKTDINNIVFDRITFEGDNSLGIVEDIYQDPMGFIWFATKNGLYRFDGYTYKAYYFNRNDSTSLSNNIVLDIIGDFEGKIWIGTENGLNLYDPVKDNFRRYYASLNDSCSLSSNLISKLAIDAKNRLWIATINNGLCMLDIGTGKIQQYNTHQKGTQKIISNNLNTVYVDKNETIWVGTSDFGAFYFSPGKAPIFLLPGPADGKHLGAADVQCISDGPDANIWLGTKNSGIATYNKSNSEFNYYKNTIGKSTSLSSNSIQSIVLDSRKNLWVCTEDGGLNLFQPSTQSFISYRHEPSNTESISGNSLRCIFEDNAGNYWIGTFLSGVNYINTLRKPFFKIQPSILEKNKISYNLVSSILMDTSGFMWLGLDSEGLIKLNTKTNQQEIFRHGATDPSSISANKPLSLREDKYGNIWMGIFDEGLSCYNQKTGNFTNFIPDGTTNNPRGLNVWYILVENEQLLLAHEKGIDIFDFKTKQFSVFPLQDEPSPKFANEDCWTIFRDSKNRYFIGTQYHGMIVYNSPDGSYRYFEPEISNPESISDKWVLNFLEDSKHRIWIGTNGGGLNLWLENENKFKCFTIQDGFGGNIINSQTEDSEGYLWIATNRGITKFNHDSNSIVNYDNRDGIHGNDFLINSSFKSKEGIIYFGGRNGLTYFSPSDIRNNTRTPALVFTSFEIFNKEVEIDGKNSPLTKNIALQKEIHLQHSQSVFTIQFAALNYSNPAKNRYRYRLEDIEEQWNEIGNQRSVTFSHLAPGKYTFHVIASNNDNIWNTEGAKLVIIVHPPIFKTWWFILSELFVLLLIIYVIYRVRVNNINTLNKRLTVMVNERTKILNNQNVEINRQNLEISHQRDLATNQRDQILLQNEELEIHRSRLSEMVDKRTLELLEAKKRAEESDHLKTAFLENISHEIRTPMNAIIGFINLLAEHHDDQVSREYYLRIINDSGRSLLRLIEDIIDFSRIQTGGLRPTIASCNLHELVKQLLSIYREKLSREKPEINILYELPDETLIINTDSRKLTQIFSKLLENSIKFTEQGYVKLGVHEIANNSITFYVEDTGIGIRDHLKEKVFERFFKIEEDNPNRLFRGAGLGLALAKQLCILMGGDIWVESEFGKGSKFYFTLPLSICANEKEAAKAISYEDGVRWKGKKILVAEDEDSNFLLIEAFFKNTGVLLKHAHDGIEFLEMIDKDANVDLVILDIKMPRMNGLNVLKIVRETNQKLPVIAQSAYDHNYYREKSMEYGCNEFMIKPLKKDEFIEIVSRYLG